MGTILCGSNTTTEDFARWVLGTAETQPRGARRAPSNDPLNDNGPLVMRLIRTCERVTGTVLPSNPGGYGFSVRIVSLLPSTTEILFAIGAGGDVVGVTFECDYPPEACSRRIVSTSALPSNLSAAEIDTAVSAALARGEDLYHLDRDALIWTRMLWSHRTCVRCALLTSVARRPAATRRRLSLARALLYRGQLFLRPDLRSC